MGSPVPTRCLFPLEQLTWFFLAVEPHAALAIHGCQRPSWQVGAPGR